MFPKKEITSIQFGISSPEELVSQSVAKIESTKLTGPGSVYDVLTGAMDNGDICASCSKSAINCSGHMSHCELNTFILHPMFLRYITNFIKCLCIKCYRVVLTQTHFTLDGILKYQGENRFSKIVEKLDKVSSCYHCNAPKPKITFQQKTGDIVMKIVSKRKNDKGKTIVLSDYDIKKIFDNMLDEDIRLLGFKPELMHPKNLVLSVLPIMPPKARPYVISDNITCDDDITISLHEIVKANKLLATSDDCESKKEKALQTLKFRVKTLMNNSANKARHSNNRPLKGIKERLSGKEGLIRKNLMGKRRDQSSRTVISADPTLRMDEIAIPPEVAANLTMPDRVCELNKQFLQDLVDRGKANFVFRGSNKINLKYATMKRGTILLPGDKIIRGDVTIDPNKPDFVMREGDHVLKKSGEVCQVQLNTKKPFKIEIGDTVERQLINGDIVAFNRQPTLHKGSIMAKRVVIRPGKTFRFALSSCKS
jgi:DNA-directed RNA polymerase beta' subunit